MTDPKEIRRARKAVVRALVDYEAAKRFNSPTLRYTTAEALTAACDEYNTLTNRKSHETV